MQTAAVSDDLSIPITYMGSRNEAIEEVYMDELNGKYLEKIRSFIQPNTLRKSEPSTEVEKYLVSRD